MYVRTYPVLYNLRLSSFQLSGFAMHCLLIAIVTVTIMYVHSQLMVSVTISQFHRKQRTINNIILINITLTIDGIL